MFSQIKYIKAIEQDFCSDAWLCPRGGTWGPQGVKIIFFEHGHVVYQIEGDDERNRIQVKFSPKGQTGDLGVRSNIQFSLQSIWKI